MAKPKKKAKQPEKTAPISLTFEHRVVQASPTTFIVVENMLKFAVVEVQGRTVVVPLIEGAGESRCYVYPGRIAPVDAIKRTVDSLWKKVVSPFIKKIRLKR